MVSVVGVEIGADEGTVGEDNGVSGVGVMVGVTVVIVVVVIFFLIFLTDEFL